MAHLFISYAAPDRRFALRLAHDLTQLSHQVWLDLWALAIGDSLVGGISAGLAQADYLIAVLSASSTQSAWMEREWEVVTSREITERRTIVLPVVVTDCQMPLLLSHKRFADFRPSYEIGLAQLAMTLQAGICTAPDHIMPGRNHHPTAHQRATSPHDNTDALWYTPAMVTFPPTLAELTIELGIPYIGKVSGRWKPDADEQAAAWELYIELVTRVAVTGLQPDEGSLREALASLYAIFTITRDVLHKYGPSVARHKAGSDVSFGYLAIAILNYALRPVLAKWHPLLLEYEQSREATHPALEYERRWERSEELRLALQETQQVLRNYASILAQVAGIPELYRSSATNHSH